MSWGGDVIESAAGAYSRPRKCVPEWCVGLLEVRTCQVRTSWVPSSWGFFKGIIYIQSVWLKTEAMFYNIHWYKTFIYVRVKCKYCFWGLMNNVVGRLWSALVSCRWSVALSACCNIHFSISMNWAAMVVTWSRRTRIALLPRETPSENSDPTQSSKALSSELKVRTSRKLRPFWRRHKRATDRTCVFI